MSTYLSDLDSAPAPGPMKAGKDLVYQRPYPKRRFSQDTLTEYAGYAVDGVPLFPTVGIDHSFCQSASTRQLAHYAEQVPEHFRFCSKVWEEITIPAYPNLPRYGAKAGKPNPRFLDTGSFRDFVCAPAPARRLRGAPASRSDKPDRLPAPRERSGGAVDRCAAATRHPHARHMHVAPADPPALVIAYFDIT